MSALKRVHIVGPNHGPVARMWADFGTSYSPTIKDADIVCFTGGADIHPSLYGEVKMEQTYPDKDRDDREVDAWWEAQGHGKYIVGICRGAQLICALTGGKLWQHVDNHRSSHAVIDVVTGATFWVSSTHHQQMRPNAEGEVLAVATHNGTFSRKREIMMELPICNRKLAAKEAWHRDQFEHYPEAFKYQPDVEVVWYDTYNALAFQPHPEYSDTGNKDTRNYFKQLISRTI